MKILVTTTSLQDTPGKHHDLLANTGWETIRRRGPFGEARMLELVQSGDGFDGLLNGDDAITARVIDAALPRLQVISKYGVGLDSIDVDHATQRRIPVLFTPGVNQTTVAEHALGLMIAVAKRFWPHLRAVKAGQWRRETGVELFGKTLGVVGLGRIGKELVIRAAALGMTCIAFDQYVDTQFTGQHGVRMTKDLPELLREADVISLHANLSERSRGMINRRSLAMMKKGAILINTARGGLVVEEDVAAACRSGQLYGYAADVLEQEPIRAPHPFQDLDNVMITPHIASRTLESVRRQGLRATLNLVNYLKGEKDYIQANKF